MTTPNVPSEAEIARDMISPSAQKRAAKMLRGFRPFESEPYSQYDADLAMYGTPDQKLVMQAVKDSPYMEDVMYAGMAETGFDGSYEGLKEIVNRELDAHYSGAATMPNFYTDRRADEDVTHLDYAYDALQIMKTVYPENVVENNLFEQKLDAFIKMGDEASASKDPVLQRGLPIRPELLPDFSTEMKIGEPFIQPRDEKQFDLINKSIDRKVKKLRSMLDEEMDSYSAEKPEKDRQEAISNITTIDSKIKSLETERANLLKMYNMEPE